MEIHQRQYSCPLGCCNIKICLFLNYENYTLKSHLKAKSIFFYPKDTALGHSIWDLFTPNKMSLGQKK